MKTGRIKKGASKLAEAFKWTFFWVWIVLICAAAIPAELLISVSALFLKGVNFMLNAAERGMTRRGTSASESADDTDAGGGGPERDNEGACPDERI